LRELLSCIAVCVEVGSTALYAQTFVPAEDQALEVAAQEEIVPLADLIDTMTDAESNQMEETAMGTESLTFDVEQMIEAVAMGYRSGQSLTLFRWGLMPPIQRLDQIRYRPK